MLRVQLAQISSEGLRYLAPLPKPTLWQKLSRKLKLQKHPEAAQEKFLLWSEIQEIQVFKEDLFTMDLVCMKFATISGNHLAIDEDDPLWKQLLDTLPEALSPSCAMSHWFDQVMHPAFEPCETNLCLQSKSLSASRNEPRKTRNARKVMQSIECNQSQDW